MLRPSPLALSAAESLSRRNKGRAAQVRRLFIERDHLVNPTPLAEMLRGGRGGHVRLKTYLSVLWLAAAPPHDVSYPARAWASLLDLEDPSGRGARRVNDAFSWLENHRYVNIQDQPGHPNRVTLMRESGRLTESGKPVKYTVPGAAYNALSAKNAPPEQLRPHRYVKLEAPLWTSGWMACLSGSAVAMYLVLLAEQGLQDDGAELWFSPDVGNKRYSLSDDTRSKGLNELRRAGLIWTFRRPVSSDVFDVQRFRNVYMLVPSRLNDAAEIPSSDAPAASPLA